MSNNDIIPGFDEEKPRLDDTWIIPDQIMWTPLKVNLEKDLKFPDVVIVRLEGEIEAFNGSYLAAKLIKAISNGIKCLYIDLEKTTLGDYREVLVSGLQKKLYEEGGTLIIKKPPSALLEYWKLFGFWSLFLEFKNLYIVESENQARSQIERQEKNRESNLKLGKIKTIFPLIIKCLVCGRSLKVNKISTFLCPNCRTRQVINEYGEIHLV